MIVSLAKLLVPGFPANRQPRPRLLATLRAALERGSALLVAPPGYGKTVALAELVSAQPEPCVWLQLDDSDNDPASFTAALLSGVGRALPQVRGRIGEVDPAEPDRALTMLVNALIDLPPGEWLLVLDDLHHVSNPEVLRLIQRLFDSPPPGLRLVVASRSLPALPVARWRASGALGVVEADDLRLTVDEAAGWLRRTLPDIGDASVAKLVERTEGWPVGMQLASQLLESEGSKGIDKAVDDLLGRLQGTHPMIAGYLMEEVLARLEPEVQQFLLDTSTLPLVEARTCAELLAGEAPAGPDPGALLQSLAAGHAFVQRLSENDRLYRYHQFFREFLLSHAQRRDPDRLRRLRSRAARTAEARGEVDEAVTLHLANDDMGSAAELLARHGDSHLRAGRTEALHRWLVQLEPEAHVRPELLLLHGRVLHLMGRLSQALARLQRALQATRQAVQRAITPDVGPELASCAVADDLECQVLVEMATIARSQGDYLRAQEWSLAATEVGARAAVGAATRAAAWIERAKTEGHLKGMAAGRHMAERALAELTGPEVPAGGIGAASGGNARTDAHLIAALLRSLGQVCWWSGDVDAAVRHLGDALRYLGSDDTPQAADVHLALAIPTLYRLDHATALGHASRALETFQRFEQRERLPAAYAAMGNALMRAGEHERAEACLREAMSIADEIGGASYDYVMAAGYLAQLLELQGRTADAVQVAEEALWVHEGSPTVYEVYVCRSVLADLYLSLGRAEDAERIYRRLVALGEERQYRIPLAMAYFGLAYMCLERGDQREGDEHADRSLELLAPTHAWQLYADQGKNRARRVCDSLLARHPVNAFLARVLAALEPAPAADRGGAAAREVSEEPLTVSVSLMGELVVEASGSALPAGAWVSAKARELLAYLVTMRSTTITVEQALHALWPDEPDRAKTAFHTALYRLRSALRTGAADDRKFVLVEGRRYRLDVALFSVDVDRFDALLAQAGKAPPDRARSLLAAADALVRGEYLQGLDHPWVLPERRRLADAHAEALVTLASRRLERGENAAALATARRLASLEPYSERACLLELRALARLGDFGAMERRFREFDDALLVELGVRASDDTRRAFADLRAGSDGRERRAVLD